MKGDDRQYRNPAQAIDIRAIYCRPSGYRLIRESLIIGLDDQFPDQ